jgi:cyclopropane-fatty-acyl-phospholipid synthase
MVDACTTATNLRLVALDDIGLHYAETLRRWRANVAAHRAEIAELGFDDSFVRLWNLYLAYCEAAFEERHISDVQMLLAKPGWRPNLALPTVVRPT